MGMVIENPGMLTTVQDGGRFGYEQYGVSPAGPMDLRAFHIANLLVGNDLEEAELEMTVMGASIRFTEPAVVAVTGADMAFEVNGEPAPMYRALSLGRGDRLSFQAAKTGCRTYLAVAGGMYIDEVMGSRSTLVKNKLGGFEGRPLRKEDAIGLRVFDAQVENLPARWVKAEKKAPGAVTLRVIPGPQDDRFTEKGLHSFFHTTYTVSQDFDRMGYRLDGAVIEHRTDGNIISDGIVTGSVQVPTSGQPIIMMADHQSIGGYTKIATVISVDLPLVGQCRAGDQIRFQKIGIERAQDLYVAYYREMEELRQRMKHPVEYKKPRFFNIHVGGRGFSLKVEEHD